MSNKVFVKIGIRVSRGVPTRRLTASVQLFPVYISWITRISVRAAAWGVHSVARAIIVSYCAAGNRVGPRVIQIATRIAWGAANFHLHPCLHIAVTVHCVVAAVRICVRRLRCRAARLQLSLRIIPLHSTRELISRAPERRSFLWFIK